MGGFDCDLRGVWIDLGALWDCGRDWWDLVYYDKGVPILYLGALRKLESRSNHNHCNWS